MCAQDGAKPTEESYRVQWSNEKKLKSMKEYRNKIERIVRKINHTRFNNKQPVWIGDKIPQNPARGSAAIIFSYGRADRNGKRKIIGLKQVSKLNSIALEEKRNQLNKFFHSKPHRCYGLLSHPHH